jgi:hypothetical protein
VKELGRRRFDDSTIAKLEQAQVIFPRHALLLNFLFKFLFENLIEGEGEERRERERCEIKEMMAQCS